MPSRDQRWRRQTSPTVFTQITNVLDAAEFARCVGLAPTTRPTRSLTAYDHFLARCFAHLTYRDRLRDGVACLNARQTLLEHLGFRGRLSRTNLAYANRQRDWRLFAAVAPVLIRRAARLYQDEPAATDLPAVAFALDSSLISLARNLFPWGDYARSRQAALKLHLLLSLQGHLPAWAAVTAAHFPDLKILDRIPARAGAYQVLERGQVDFIRLLRLPQAGAYFVVRNQHPGQFRVLGSRSVAKRTGLRCEQTLQLTSRWSRKSYPEWRRRIRGDDAETQVTLVLLTHQFDVPALVLAARYRQRWQVELFFKWIKQQLRIRHFQGRRANAVRCQIWSAIGAYLLVAIVKKRLQLPQSLNEILPMVSVNIFEQLPREALLATAPGDSGEKVGANLVQNMFCFND